MSSSRILLTQGSKPYLLPLLHCRQIFFFFLLCGTSKAQTVGVGAGNISIWRHVSLQSTSAVSDSLRPNGLLCPFDSPDKILEFVAISSSVGPSQPRDQTHVFYASCNGRWVLYLLPPGIPGTGKNQLLVEEGRKWPLSIEKKKKILLSQDIAVKKRNKLLL